MNKQKWICPVCGEPTCEEVWLGWRECKNCGWQENRPTDLKEVSD